MNRNVNIHLPSLLIGAALGIGILLLVLRPWQGVPDSVQDQLNLIQVQRDSLMKENTVLKLERSENAKEIVKQDSIITVYKNRKYAGNNYLRNANRGQQVQFYAALDTNGIFGPGR